MSNGSAEYRCGVTYPPAFDWASIDFLRFTVVYSRQVRRLVLPLPIRLFLIRRNAPIFPSV
jgi:hypothetical protein